MFEFGKHESKEKCEGIFTYPIVIIMVVQKLPHDKLVIVLIHT